MKHIKTIHKLLLLIGCVILPATLFAQLSNATVKELKIGDALPELPPHRIVNYKSDEVNLADFKGKLLVLDFWNTYCGTCIEQFPKYEKIMQKYGDNIQILPVTSGKEKDILSFWNKNPIAKVSKLPSIVNDVTLGSLFKYHFMPHLVWIDKKGKVIATTSHEYLTEDRMLSAMNGNISGWRMKNDIAAFDYDRPLVNANIRSTGDWINYSVLTGAIAGVPKKGNHKVIDSIANTVKYSWINTPINHLYISAIQNSNKHYWIGERNIIYKVKDLTSFFWDEKKSTRFDWNADHTYCFETLFNRNASKENILKSMFANLNSSLNLNARLEDKNTDVLVILKKENDGKKTASSDVERTSSKSQHYGSTDELARSLTWTLEKKIVIDEAREIKNIDLEESCLTNFSQLREELNKHNYDIIKAKRMLKMLVISD